MFRIFVTLLTLVCFTGCTTLQALPDAQPATIQESVKPGDTVEIERVDGTRQSLKVESVTADTLVGTHDNKRYEVPLANIRSVSTRAMTGEAKLWTTIGVIAALGAIIVTAGGGGSGDRSY